MSTVPVKSAESQASAMVLSVRELLIRQRTQAINALRGHAAEFGVIAAKGPANVVALMDRVSADPQIPEAARAMLAVLAKQVDQLDAEFAILDTQLRPYVAAATTELFNRLLWVAIILVFPVERRSGWESCRLSVDYRTSGRSLSGWWAVLNNSLQSTVAT